MAQDLLSALSELVSVDSVPTTGRPQTAESRALARALSTNRGHTVGLVTVDFVAALIAVPLSLILLAKVSTVAINSHSHFATNLARDAAFPVMVVLGLAASGLYGTTRHALRPSILRYAKDLVFGIGTGFMLTIGLGLLEHVTFHVPEPNPTQLLLAVPVASVLVIVGRTALRGYANTSAASRVVVVGSGALAERIAVCLRTWSGMSYVGRVAPTAVLDPDAIGTISELPELCDRLSIDRVIIGFPDDITEESVARLRHLRERIHISVVPRYFDLMSFQTKLVDLSGIPMIEMAPIGDRRVQLLLKRALDITVSALVLVILSPLLVAVALAVAVSSPGSILFRQRRTGYQGTPFTMYKFRSMTPVDRSPQTSSSDQNGRGTSITVTGAPGLAYSFEPLHVRHRKSEDVERVTRVGKFLRSRGLDELPQFLNVLKGDMSIVGPRPLVLNECTALEQWQSRRLEVRPGITGLWQVSGRNDLGENDLFILDYVYVTSWSMWWDIKILLETPRAMLRGLGAY